MASFTCGFNMVLLTIISILIIAFTNDIFTTIPVLKKLFIDPVNYFLLITLVVLIILIDLPSGIVIAFLVLYLSVHMNSNKNLKRDNFANTDLRNNANTNNIRSESEFIYNNSKPFPNLNLKPFQPLSQEEINKVVVTPVGCVSNKSGTVEPDFITSVGLPNRDGYDVTGCRYDFKTSPQNLTKYGPPLAGCSAYSGEQAKICGTVFYPLNG